MGQEDILCLLEKYPDKWFKTKDLSLFMDVSIKGLSYALIQLRKYDAVKFREVHSGRARRFFEYKCKGVR